MSCCYNRAPLEYVMQTNKIGLEICKVTLATVKRLSERRTVPV